MTNPYSWIGKLVTIPEGKWHKPQLVRIIAIETASEPDGGFRLWFWAKYA